MIKLFTNDPRSIIRLGTIGDVRFHTQITVALGQKCHFPPIPVTITRMVLLLPTLV